MTLNRAPWGWLRYLREGVLLVLSMWVIQAQAQIIFTENVGVPSSNTNVNSYTGWQNGAPIAFSTTTGSDVRTTTPSTGYTGASGGGNVFMGTSGGNSKDFLIEGINSNGYINLTLSFGLLKNNNNPIDLTVSVSSDGVNWTSLAFTGPPSANLWVRTTASGTIPATSNLRIKFEKNSTIQYRIDDIELTGVVSGPLVNFNTSASLHGEAAGTVSVAMTINPATTAATTLTITIGAGSTATYGAGNDYTTSPAAGGGTTITRTVPIGSTSAQFDVNINDDLIQEPDETIIFTITNATGGTNIGSTDTHTLTIQDNDYYPTVEFVNTSMSALEGAGPQTIPISFTLPHPATSITIQVTDGPGAVYGVGNDYTTNIPISGGAFTTIVFPGGATTVSFTITPLTDGIPESTEYVTFTIISTSDPTMVIGPNSSCTFYIGDIDSPPAVFNPGDLVVVGVNANNGSCGGTSGDDHVSFFCFKEITFGTELIITDQGYERCNAGQWGNQEGTVRMRRTGPAIPAGQVVTFKISNLTGSGNMDGLAPDAGWTCTNLNTPSGGGGINAVNLNVNGDQLFFMQGGTWTSGSNNGNNATFDGTILYAFSTNPTNPWSAHCSNTPNQRSNLPMGVECFSTAPTLASDFNKYTGPLTPATQRDWIIRLDNVANWTSYANCTQYNSTGPNWLAAPILPIIPGAMTHGLWRGAINTDWFECKNWDDARIPTSATDVVVNETASRNCAVGLATGLNPGGTADCASLTHTNILVNRQVSIEENSTLNVGGRFLIDNPGGAFNLTAMVKADATLNVDSIRIAGYDATVGAQLQANASGSRINCSGNLVIDQGGRLNLQLNPVGGTLDLGGDLVNKEDEGRFQDIFSVVILSGSGDQYIRNNNILENFYDLRINKAGGDVYLTAPIAIRNELDLSQGRLFTTPTELITLNGGATVINTTNASFVHGPFKRIGNTDFTFPIGKNNSYRPASLSANSGGAGAAFTAEYFHHPGPGGGVPGNPLGLAHDASLHHVSDCEHWQIDRSNGAPNAIVTLSWRAPESCGVTNTADMRVAYWDPGLSMWVDRGGSPITGNNSAGTVSTPTAQTTFFNPANYWTLASLTNENPLPIELLSFTAKANKVQVDLQWATASERNNDFFTVERSVDAIDFQPVLFVDGAGNSQALLNYSDVDRAPMNGLSYYRLRQTDFDGTSEVSDAVPVFFNGTHGEITVLYGADGTYVQHGAAPGSRLDVVDATGRTVRSTVISEPGLLRLPMDGLAQGAYLLRLTDGNSMGTARFVH